MSSTQIAVLGAIAGVTIFIGLPLGRMNAEMARTRAWLNALAIGILVFLLWDILAHAWEPIDVGLAERDGAVVGLALVFATGVGVGLIGLVYFDRWILRRSRAQPSATSTVPARSLALMIAVGIGLHNFAEGLAIGNSAATGELELAVLLVLGFAAHNATEGFGIVAPMAAERIRPSWMYLVLLGVIGGGPTVVGTVVGQQFTSDVMSIAFLALAAGSILYVVIELLAVARRQGMKVSTTWGIFVGLMLGFGTDAILVIAGA